MKKIMAVLVILTLLVTTVAFWAWSQKETFILGKVKAGFSALTGTEVVIKGVQVKKTEGLLFLVNISEIEVHNPAGFPVPQMALLTDVEFIISPWALLKGAWHADHAFAYLKKANVQYGRDGKFNLENIQALHPREEKGVGKFHIKRLELKMGQIDYLDFRVQPPLEEPYAFDGKIEVYDHIASPEVLIQAPALKFIEKANKGSLGLARGKIQESITKNTGNQAE